MNGMVIVLIALTSLCALHFDERLSITVLCYIFPIRCMCGCMLNLLRTDMGNWKMLFC